MAGGGELRSGRAAEHDRKMVREKYVFYTLSLRSAVKKQHFSLTWQPGCTWGSGLPECTHEAKDSQAEAMAVETESKSCCESAMYLSLEDADLQPPCRCSSLSAMPELAAAVAPPDRRLWRPYDVVSVWVRPTATFRSSVALL